MGERSQRTTLGKALEVNLRNDLYGAFAEIGAGQEVARFFFTAGKASQTIAKTISAYDMTISDEIYGREKSGRYVCESRLVKMLDHEYSLLVQRLQKSRGDSTRFFAFANTVTTQPPNSNRPSHGWMGVRFQATPNGPTNEIILHVRMLDKYRLLQQEALGILGVNLIHTAFFCSQNEDDFIPSIVENLKDEQIVIDVLKVRGDGMKHFNEALLNLELVNRGISEAILFSPEREILNISDAVFGKSLLFQRGIFRPITVTHLDIQAKGLSHIKSDIAKLKEGKTKKSDVLPILEITTRSLEVDDGHVNEKDFLDRVEAITSLGQHVLISRFNYFYELKQFFRSYTPNFMAIVIGANHLDNLFDQAAYQSLRGGLLEGLGRLIDDLTKIYVYPHKTESLCLTSKTFHIKGELDYIYKYFHAQNQICDIAGCEDIDVFYHSKDVMQSLQKGTKDWEKMVPESLRERIRKANKGSK